MLKSSAVILASSLLLACGKPPTTQTTTQPVGQVDCLSIGLAAVDLDGQCRASPQATMGALEAIRE